MTRSRFKIVATAALAVTATQAMLALPSASTEAPDEELAVASPGRLIVDTIPDDTRPLQAGQSDADVPFSPLTVRTVRTPVDVSAQIRFCFAADVPQDVRTAALRAGEAWDDALSLRGPVLEIDVHWTSFDNPSALGAAGPSSFIVHPDLPDPAVRYPVALANELLGRDLAPRDACDEDADGEVMLFLNRAAGAGTDFWHLGTDDPPPGKVDLTSVVIHELAHGLGFTGSAEVAGGSLAWPDDGGVPYAYDVHASTCERVVLNVCESGQLLPTSVGTLGPLTSDSLWFNAGLGNLRLHAPPAWDVGSSFSHLDEDHYPESSQSSLMTPFLEAGERHRTVDHATTTVLQQLGWTVSALPTTTPRIGLTSVDGGVRISFGSPDLRLGPAPEQYRVRIERLVRENNGSVSFVEGFEPLVLNEPAITVRGLVNGDFYRLAIQGLSPAGAGPEVTSGLFSPGVDGDLAAALQLTNQVYVDLREDQPSASESSSTAAAVIAMGPGPALTELLDQPEFSAHASIARLYLGFLGRVPDAVGIEFWIDQHRSGQDLTTIATRFADSAQFELGTSLSDQEFVTRVYQTILNRPPELAGLVFWTGRLGDGMPRGRLLLEISESIEHRLSAGPTSEVIAAYVGLFDRLPTSSELTAGTSLIGQNRKPELIGSMVTSTEYQRRIAR